MTRIAMIGADDWYLWREARRAARDEDPTLVPDWPPDTDDTETYWRAELAACPVNIVAWAAGELAGSAALAPAGPDGDLSLHAVWVHRGSRGRGVGPALLASVVSAARASRANTLVMNVPQDNPAAEKFYRRMGFRVAIDGGRPVTVEGNHRLELPV